MLTATHALDEEICVGCARPEKRHVLASNAGRCDACHRQRKGSLLTGSAHRHMRLLPACMHAPLLDYIERGIAPASPFLQAVIQGDWMEARRQADFANTEAMRYWQRWMDQHAPAACHGSPERFAAWTA